MVPRYLVEQVRDREWTVDDFYKYQGLNCLVHDQSGSKLNPFNHLYVLADSENLVKGMLWFVIDPLSKDIVVNTFSVDKEYWNTGEAVRLLADHVKEVAKKLKIRKVYWITNYPKHSERYGFKRSKSVLMEYDREKEEEREDETGPPAAKAPQKKVTGGNRGKNADGIQQEGPQREHANPRAAAAL